MKVEQFKLKTEYHPVTITLDCAQELETLGVICDLARMQLSFQNASKYDTFRGIDLRKIESMLKHLLTEIRKVESTLYGR